MSFKYSNFKYKLLNVLIWSRRKGKGMAFLAILRPWNETIHILDYVSPFIDTLWIMACLKVFYYNPKINEEMLEFTNSTFPTAVWG